MKKILVTGSSGHIGSEVYKLLKENKEYEVYPFDIKYVSNQNILNTKEVANAVSGMNTVVHLAAIPHPHKQFSGRDYFERNVVGTFNLIEASVKAGVKRFIYSSSTSYYGVAKNVTEVKAPIGTERTLNYVQKTKPRDSHIPYWLFYGSSKIASEALLASYGYSKLIEMAILRFSPCPADDSKIDSIFDRWGTYVHVQDAARAIKLAVDYEKELWYEIFNISTKGTNINKAHRILGY